MENHALPDRPLVSVILITYNHRDYIEKALQSVLDQKVLFPMEILVGDDGSTDGTSDVVRRYSAAYPELIFADIRRENVGATRNAYLLLQRARGRYLASLEGDDYWTDPCKLQKQVDFLESHPQFIGCAHRVCCVDRLGRPMEKSPHWLKQKEVFSLRDFRGIYLPGQASTLVRRNIFLHPQHDYSVLIKADPLVSDRTAALIYLLQGDFYCFPQVMGAYRYAVEAGGENITARVFREDSRVQRDYLMTCELERYARCEFGVSVSFASLKAELYAKALCKYLLRRSSLLKEIARQIRRDPSVGWKGPVLFPRNCIKFLARRLGGR